MRRLFTLLAAVAVLVGLMAAPAAADPPTVFTIPPPTPFLDPDPCTGLDHLITFNVTLHEHQGHSDNFVARAEVTGFTSSGYVLIGGHDNFQANNNVLTGSFKEMWRNPVDGSKFQASGTFRITGNGIVVNEFELRCVGAPTLP